MQKIDNLGSNLQYGFMDDPIEKLRKLFQEQQAMNELKDFAQKAETAQLEKEWKNFVGKILTRAFDRVRAEVFGQTYQPLTEKTDPGFKVKDRPDSEFWFWIEFKGCGPVAKAARKFDGSSVLKTVATPQLSPKQNFELGDVTEEDVLAAIAFAYEKSFFGP